MFQTDVLPGTLDLLISLRSYDAPAGWSWAEYCTTLSYLGPLSLASAGMRVFLARRRPQDVVVGWRRRSRQRARVLTAVKTRRYAPPPLRGADGLDGGSAHALQTGLVRRRNKHDPLHVVVDDLFGMARFSALVDTLLPDDDRETAATRRLPVPRSSRRRVNCG